MEHLQNYRILTSFASDHKIQYFCDFCFLFHNLLHLFISRKVGGTEKTIVITKLSQTNVAFFLWRETIKEQKEWRCERQEGRHNL